MLLLGLWLSFTLVALSYLLFEIWPAVQATGSTEIEFYVGLPNMTLSPDGALLVLAFVSGGLGSSLHAIISFGDYVGNQKLRSAWFWWYLMRAPAGAVLALIFYLAVRAGFLTSADSGDVNSYGIATVGALAGLFAKQALDKLEEIFTAAFGSKDEARADSLTNPVPTITEIDPASFPRLSAEVLVIRGSGFTVQSTVRVARPGQEEGDALRPQVVYVGPSELRVTLDSEATAEAGVLYVTVVNPEPGGGVAGPFEVEVVEGDEEGLGDTEPTVEPPGAAETAAVDAVAGPTETVEETAELDAPEDVEQDDDSN